MLYMYLYIQLSNLFDANTTTVVINAVLPSLMLLAGAVIIIKLKLIPKIANEVENQEHQAEVDRQRVPIDFGAINITPPPPCCLYYLFRTGTIKMPLLHA
eukprot:214361_1